MLVAGASLSLIAPIVAQASDVVNLEEMNSYTRSSKKSKRIDSKSFINEVNEDIASLEASIDGSEVKQYEFEAGTFSDTTTLDTTAVFAATRVDGAHKVNTAGATDTLQTMYTYTMNLNTSFTGDDNLYVRLRTGNGRVRDANGRSIGSFYEKTAFYHTDTYSGGVDTLAVDKLWYTTPIGSSENWSATIGGKIENYYMYAAPVSIYRPGFHKAFKLGSLSGAFGASTATGVGVKYVGDSGFAASTNVVSKGANSSTGGFLTNQDESKWDSMLAYTQDQYHVSLTLSQQHEDWSSFSYYATDAAATVDEDSNATAYAARAYWRPEESGTKIPEISVGYDIINLEGQSDNHVKEATSYFVGLGWQDVLRDSDYFGIGFGQPLRVTDTANGQAADDEGLNPFMWEASYQFKVNDSLTMIPAVFGASDIQSATDQDIFGLALTTKFKF